MGNFPLKVDFLKKRERFPASFLKLDLGTVGLYAPPTPIAELQLSRLHPTEGLLLFRPGTPTPLFQNLPVPGSISNHKPGKQNFR